MDGYTVDFAGGKMAGSLDTFAITMHSTDWREDQGPSFRHHQYLSLSLSLSLSLVWNHI